jgi:hypothetical protein
LIINSTGTAFDTLSYTGEKPASSRSVAAGDERDLDVWLVREGTVHFGPQRAVPVSSRRMDHDGDGINDKRFFFRLGDTGIRCDNADDPVLTGEIDHDPMQDEEDFSPLIVAVGSVVTSGCDDG